MTKAEEQSYKFWPVRIESTPFAPDGQDVNEVHRKIWQDGYEQAEKDFQKIVKYIEDTLICIDHQRAYHDAQQFFCLSPEDVSKIFNKVRELQIKYPATEACFEEVAEWFNNLK